MANPKILARGMSAFGPGGRPGIGGGGSITYDYATPAMIADYRSAAGPMRGGRGMGRGFPPSYPRDGPRGRGRGGFGRCFVEFVEGAECVVPWIGRPRGLIETALKNTVRIIIMTTVEV
ncbi:unnamed protein product [Heligmosomoides polygyrus]|uniref:RRM domain-containing protein n=1 Tax=Heligmosomoides polygyrus TaxID=6339 RepID=A0A183FWN3_HELPZ|nr:unnamed protein product [Heligmosomoides polygyrus]